jgi:hypothetical protein
MSSDNKSGVSMSLLPAMEDERFEFKSSRTDHKELGKKLGCAVSGFANAGGGTFVAGVDNKTGNADGGFTVHDFSGRQSLCEWADQIINGVKPTPHCDMRLVHNPDGRGVIEPDKAVLVVSIGESQNGPHMAPDGRYYIRAGRHTERATQFIVEAIWAKRHCDKPRLTHLIRQNPDDAEIIQIGVVALTDSPAIDVQLKMEPLPGLLRGHECSEFPVSIAVIDKHTPFFFDITTRCDTERNRDEEFDLTVSYSDLASRDYEHHSRINLFRALPSLRFGKKGVNEIAKALESIASEVVRRSLGPPTDAVDGERDICAFWQGATIRPPAPKRGPQA